MKCLHAVKRLSLFLPLAFMLLLFSERSAFAQSVESDLRGLVSKMPPAEPYFVTFNMSSFGRFLFTPSNYAVTDGSAGQPSQFAYAKVLAPRGAVLSFSGIWDHSKVPIPQPTTNPDTDACPHTHMAYGVYSRINTSFAKFWTYVGGGGKYGRRSGSSCSVTATKQNDSGDANRWGTNEVIRTVSSTDEYFVMSGQAPTHGWGNCGGFLCFQKFTFIMVR